METKEFIQNLGYNVEDVPFQRENDYTSKSVNMIVLWSDGTYSAFFNVLNNMVSLFWALDMVGDPAVATRIWWDDAKEPFVDINTTTNTLLCIKLWKGMMK